MLDKLPVPGRPTILITVGEGPIVFAVGAGGGCLDIFTLIYPFSSLSLSLWETARYRLKYCLKGPLNPKQPTNQPTYSPLGIVRSFFWTRLWETDICHRPYWPKLASLTQKTCTLDSFQFFGVMLASKG